MMNVLCASHPLFLPLRICVLTMLLCSMTTTGLSVNVISCTLSNTSTWHGHLYVYMYVCIVCKCMCVHVYVQYSCMAGLSMCRGFP